MSTQSIIHKDIDYLSNKADDVIICIANNYLLEKKYGIVKKYNREDFKKLYWLERLLCENHCRMECVKEELKEKLNLLIIKYS